MNTIDITGRRFGAWVALERGPNDIHSGGARWICKCDCGTIGSTTGSRLRLGLTKSCGCIPSAGNFRHGHARKGNVTRVRTIWSGMLQRCLNPRSPSYSRYGGRGIRVSYRWLCFENFLKDMGEPPSDLTLDRIDNNGGYSRHNCRWATLDDQCNNRRTCVYVEAFGEIKTLTRWHRDPRCKVTPKAIKIRLELGWPPEDAIQLAPHASRARRSK